MIIHNNHSTAVHENQQEIALSCHILFPVFFQCSTNQQLTRCVAVCTAGCVIKTISPDSDDVRGVTSVDDQLFALLERKNNQVAVYSINDYQLLRHIHWPGLKRYDMTSCVRHKCLYASDWRNDCIHRYDLSSSAVSKWSVPGSPCGLSVTPGSCHLLVTCREPSSKLVELRADSGQTVRAITLQSDIEWLRHAVQLTTGQHVVSW